ncbi:MAG: DUF4260 domain-containing protein [Chloroflexi bacterium]|nr:DUF4260 domain-containing protein [Chloroflexota bacterium]
MNTNNTAFSAEPTPPAAPANVAAPTTARTTISPQVILLRLEGLTMLIAALVLYAAVGGGWLPFVLLLLVPDLSMLPYLIRPALGMWSYNLVHTYTMPALLLGTGALLSAPVATQIALIWFAHIGMDRLFGYGLKYAVSFKDTHLQRLSMGGRGW